MSTAKDKNKAETTIFDLIPANVLREIAMAMTCEIKRHNISEWWNLSDGVKQYYAEAMEHLRAWKTGNKYDYDTMLHNVGHAIACLMFLLSLDLDHRNPPVTDDNLREFRTGSELPPWEYIVSFLFKGCKYEPPDNFTSPMS
jgi:hypothetical protein